MTGIDLVVCSLEQWDDIWRRNQFLLAGLLASDPDLRVLFVEPPADPAHLASKGGLPKPGHGLRPIDDLPEVGRKRLWSYQPTKWLPRRLGGDVDARLARRTLRTSRRLGFVDPVLWINDPSAAALMRESGWASLYDMTDDWLAANRSERQHQKLIHDEADLMRDCLEVVVCSTGLARSKGAIRQVTLLQNAVDVDRFRAPMPRPIDLPPGPQAVYVGTIHRDRIDVDLCAATSRAIREGELGGLTLVGPVSLSERDREALVGSGVRLLGARPNAQIPGYLQHAAALLVPHVVDAFTDSLDPIKLYEYLAVGRPVISTPVAGFRDLDDDFVYVPDRSGFVQSVVRCLRDPEPPGPIPRAGPIPNWGDRVVEMRAVIDRVVDARAVQSRS